MQNQQYGLLVRDPSILPIHRVNLVDPKPSHTLKHLRKLNAGSLLEYAVYRVGFNIREGNVDGAPQAMMIALRQDFTEETRNQLLAEAIERIFPNKQIKVNFVAKLFDDIYAEPSYDQEAFEKMKKELSQIQEIYQTVVEANKSLTDIADRWSVKEQGYLNTIANLERRIQKFIDVELEEARLEAEYNKEVQNNPNKYFV